MFARITRSFARCCSAASATEFALIAPVLGLAVLGMVDGWSLASTQLDMQSAIQAGSKYIVQGGRTTSSIQSVALAGWKNAPGNAAVTATKACSCGGASAGCSTLCPVTTLPPQITYTLVATGSWTAPFDVHFLTLSRSLSQTEVVRVR